MDLNISMNKVLSMLHSMSLSTSNKQWLADHLYDEVRKERALAEETAWPTVSAEELLISPEVMKIVEDVEPLPEDYDLKKEKLGYLLKKHVQ